MTVPVIFSFKTAFPGTKISVLTKAKFTPLFTQLDVEVIIADTEGTHKGIIGLYRLFRSIKKSSNVDAVADLHDVLRSRLIRTLYWFSGVKIAFINKERDELKKLTRKENKILSPLPTRFDRYKKVFNDLGFSFPLSFTSIIPDLIEPRMLGNTQKERALNLPLQKNLSAGLDEEILKYTGIKRSQWVGIAPFAAFEPKIYPLEKMKEVVKSLWTDNPVKLLFFGGGKEETRVLNEWEKEFPGTINMAGKLSLEKELKVMAHLDCMVAMDSANMHFASLTSIPVISVWGATHPLMGFTPWNQSPANQVQIPLYCRPCSVYGNVPCYRGDHACMRDLPFRMILEKVNAILKNAVL